jgi:hypothetical protein
MPDTSVRDTPYFVPADYQTHFAEPCAFFPNYKMQDWYLGTGIKPGDHPLAWRIPFDNCGQCQSANVLVIAAQFVVHPMSGDLYWDYEIVCADCGKFTTRSYAEN